MELDDLKNIWKNNRGFEAKNKAEISAMLKGRSYSIVSVLRRNVWFELIFTFTASILLLLYALTLDNGALKWTTIAMIVSFVAYSFYYVKKILLLNQFHHAEQDLKTTLKQLIDNLTGYIIFYRNSYAVLYPIYFVLGLSFGLLQFGASHFINMITTPKILIYLFALIALFFFASTWLTKWYLHKLYGRHIEKLKGLLAELEEESEN